MGSYQDLISQPDTAFRQLVEKQSFGDPPSGAVWDLLNFPPLQSGNMEGGEGDRPA